MLNTIVRLLSLAAVIGILLAAAPTLAVAQSRQVYKPGNGITLPVVVREVRPDYTAEAKASRIQGAVWLEVVVQDDGKVGEVRVTQSLDDEHGLDKAAVAAAKQWEFKPGTKDGKPVAVAVTIQLTFTLK